jgi:hypothetical protein
MKAFGVPPIVLLLLIAFSEQGGLHSPGPDLDAVDLFVGRAFITHALRAEGYTVARYEIRMGRWGRGGALCTHTSYSAASVQVD